MDDETFDWLVCGESEYGKVEVRYLQSLSSVWCSNGNSITRMAMSRSDGKDNLGRKGEGVGTMDGAPENVSGNH
jgi:hypothetical protein